MFPQKRLRHTTTTKWPRHVLTVAIAVIAPSLHLAPSPEVAMRLLAVMRFSISDGHHWFFILQSLFRVFRVVLSCFVYILSLMALWPECAPQLPCTAGCSFSATSSWPMWHSGTGIPSGIVQCRPSPCPTRQAQHKPTYPVSHTSWWNCTHRHTIHHIYCNTMILYKHNMTYIEYYRIIYI